MEQRYNPFDSIESRLQVIMSKLETISQTLATRPLREEKYYSIAEAAKKLKCAPITLYRQVNAGKVPSKRIGSRIMIPGTFVDGTNNH